MIGVNINLVIFWFLLFLIPYFSFLWFILFWILIRVEGYILTTCYSWFAHNLLIRKIEDGVNILRERVVLFRYELGPKHKGHRRHTPSFEYIPQKHLLQTSSYPLFIL